MMNRPRKYGIGKHGRRFVVWLAALSLCLNALLPTVAMAIAVEGSEAVVICTPDGYKTIRLDHDGAPLPEHKAHQGERAIDGPCAGQATARDAGAPFVHGCTRRRSTRTAPPRMNQPKRARGKVSLPGATLFGFIRGITR